MDERARRQKEQLGMVLGSASRKLMRNLLFDMATKLGHRCFRCGGELTRETFSIEHIEDWFNSEDPVKLFFSVENVAFSHLLCNTEARLAKVRKPGTRSEKQKLYNAKSNPMRVRVYDSEARRDKYLRRGT